jgi:hypothetical protein
MGSMQFAEILMTHRTDMETGKGEGCDIDEAGGRLVELLADDGMGWEMLSCIVIALCQTATYTKNIAGWTLT